MKGLLTLVGVGLGMAISAFGMPGQWGLIIVFGMVFGAASPWLAVKFTREPAPSYVPPLERPIPMSLNAIYGTALFLVAAGGYGLWLLFAQGQLEHLSIPRASTLDFASGALLGMSLFMAVSARKLVS